MISVMVAKEPLAEVKRIFSRYPEIKLAYFFGSRAAGKAGVLSDYDFALYVANGDRRKISDLRLELFERLSALLKSDQIDIVILNSVEEPELKYRIITEGKIVYEIEPFRTIVEPRILNEYFDFRSLLLRYGLTKSAV